MTLNKLLISAASMIILFGCAHRQKNDSDQSSTPAASSSSQSSSGTTAAAAPAERKDVRKVTVNGVDGEIWGTPAPGSKFSKLQIGMNRYQVENLIGGPNNGGAHPTGRQFQPFYFGGDTVHFDASYRNEGQLTYSNSSRYSSPDTLITITVNPKETGQ